MEGKDKRETVSMRTVTVYQVAQVGTKTSFEVPANLPAEEVMDYLKKHFDEIPGGEIEAENAFGWHLDEELTLEDVSRSIEKKPFKTREPKKNKCR